ncbi:MAG: LemA family protein [Tenuifilaceae bacterium]|jgi:LemA protein|uniref:LemA family protein n=1 Tax=Perlabentimonas gracilis TaxID=2715279 RepID=UPI00140992BF|nr:LemA family protein [Perlabentimonas gracilis]MDX9768948.1 LemA family protein [Tenuifilaceae bacterium]NHB68794.1 LemA family protein [Perlabentimonas gracilis]
MSPTIVIIVAAVLLLLIIIGMYNSLIRKRNEVDNAFGGMDVQLKKRYDLIPNLVATVQQYASHEKDLLEKVTQLRAKATDRQMNADEKVELDNQISGAMHGIMVAVENYPDLKASENFLNLQRTLNEVESQISAARRTYNAVITDYNNAIQVFPKSIIAGMMGLKRKEVFVIPETERQNVNVKNLFN